MSDAERLKLAREILAGHEWCGGGDPEGMVEPYCESCEAEMPQRKPWQGEAWSSLEEERAAYAAAHKVDCAWMIAMGKRDA